MDAKCGEPWGIEGYDILDAYGVIIARVYGEASRRRIVACVNACEGITTEELEHVASCSSRLQTRLDYLMLAAEAALVRLPE